MISNYHYEYIDFDCLKRHESSVKHELFGNTPSQGMEAIDEPAKLILNSRLSSVNQFRNVRCSWCIRYMKENIDTLLFRSGYVTYRGKLPL